MSFPRVDLKVTVRRRSGQGAARAWFHLFHESPRVMYMHIHAMGDAVKIAKAIHDALILSKTPFTTAAATGATQEIGIDTTQVDQIVRHSGKVNGGVYQFAIPRAEKIMDHGVVVPDSMGVAHRD